MAIGEDIAPSTTSGGTGLSGAGDFIAIARSTTSVTDGQFKTLAIPANSLTPATITATMGAVSGDTLQLHPNVSAALGMLRSRSTTLINSVPELAGQFGNAGVNISTATGTQISAVISQVTANVTSGNLPVSVSTSITGILTSDPLTGFTGLNDTSALQDDLEVLHSQMLPPGNQVGFAKIVNQCQAHINNAKDLLNTTNFLGNTKYGDFGSGIKDMGSMADQGLTNVFGSLSSAGAALSANGSMFNGIDLKNIGKPGGIVEAFTNNKLANATGLNEKLAAAGVNLDDIHNPLYANKINSVLGSIKDPTAIAAAAEQFGQANPFAGVPTYQGTDSSLYTGAAGKLLGGS